MCKILYNMRSRAISLFCGHIVALYYETGNIFPEVICRKTTLLYTCDDIYIGYVLKFKGQVSLNNYPEKKGGKNYDGRSFGLPYSIHNLYVRKLRASALCRPRWKTRVAHCNVLHYDRLYVAVNVIIIMVDHGRSNVS